MAIAVWERHRRNRREVVVRYIPPEWRGFVFELRKLAGPAIWIPLAYLSCTSGLDHTGEVWAAVGPSKPQGFEWIIIAGMMIAASYLITAYTLDFLYPRFRQSHLLGGTRLVLCFEARRVGVRIKGRWHWLRRSEGAVRFTVDAHLWAEDEELEQQRLSRVSENAIQIPCVYRDARQIWLQHGSSVFVIASVMHKLDADALVRVLQEEDEAAMAGSNTAVPGGSPYGTEAAV